MPLLSAPVLYMPPLEESLPVLIQSVKAQGLEGLTAKRIDSGYEPGARSGASKFVGLREDKNAPSVVRE